MVQVLAIPHHILDQGTDLTLIRRDQFLMGTISSPPLIISRKTSIFTLKDNACPWEFMTPGSFLEGTGYLHHPLSNLRKMSYNR
jgi:hypothetical protein